MNYLLHLRTFLDTYRAGSLTRAAQRLGITQPAASAHIASLEGMLGKPLFIRQARGVTPTVAADDLARSIAVQLDGIEATMAAAQARSSHLSGTVHLVGPAEYLSVRIGPALAPLLEEGLRLRNQTGNRDRIYAALDQGHADLAVTASPPNSNVHGFAELDRERLVLVASPRMADRIKARTITAQLLSDLPCISYDESLPLLRPFFEHVFGETPTMQAAVAAPDLRILMGMVQAGAGWTVLPDYLCAEAFAAGRLTMLPTEKSGPDNTLYLVWNKTTLRHPRILHVRDFLLRTVVNN